MARFNFVFPRSPQIVVVGGRGCSQNFVLAKEGCHGVFDLVLSLDHHSDEWAFYRVHQFRSAPDGCEETATTVAVGAEPMGTCFHCKTSVIDSGSRLGRISNSVV